ncbi:MAG: DUF3300 domain-containing protein [Dongiaceae bacterium]
MKRILRRRQALARLALCGLLVWMGALLCAGAPAQAQDAAAPEAAAAPAGALLGPKELRPLVAPIALYPDDLLAIVLPASTNPVQIVAAQRFLEGRRTEPALQPDPAWDPSILALINYPQVVAKMDADLAWTVALGNAVIDQLADVMDMIQQLRAEASASGYLQSNDYWVVIWEDDYWHIDSSDPDYIYIPDYPDEIFVRPEHPIALPPGQPALSPEHPIAYPPPVYATQLPYWSPGATFFAGAFLGAAFGYGIDWGGDDIDIDIGDDCCRGGNIGTGDLGNRVDHRMGDRFNADKQRVNGRDTLTWNGSKARRKAATGKAGAAGRAKAGTLPAKQAGGAGAGKTTPRVGDLRTGGGGSLGNYQSGRETGKSSKRGKSSLQDNRSRQPAGALSKQDRSRSRSSAGAFGGYGSGSSVYRQSNRGGGSLRSAGRRGGGGRRR